MNLEPHVHNVQVGKYGYGNVFGTYKVRYGDTYTAVFVLKGLFLQRRLKDAINRAIRKHDEGTKRQHRYMVSKATREYATQAPALRSSMYEEVERRLQEQELRYLEQNGSIQHSNSTNVGPITYNS